MAGRIITVLGRAGWCKLDKKVLPLVCEFYQKESEMGGTQSFGIVMDKRNALAKTAWEITKLGSLAELRLVTEHNDTICSVLDKSSYRGTVAATVVLMNTITLQREPAKIYEFKQTP